ncbi:RidA family protein [Desulfonatronovibrio hydrogenovorans]|uniref:RidA family protein n=1 Tax=Desulfonatronovibrio hydrogenovorans TaxID=53245 RepID=UPI000490B6CA|nr:RidA family protein [Desulfonatronovibrio hydrogenovorans]
MKSVKSLIPVATDQAPSAIGPYSQGVVAGDLLFVSGQLPIDPATGDLVKGDIAAQAAQCLDNVSAIAAEAGTDLNRAVKFSIFLTDMADFAAVNEVYASYFQDIFPARSAFQVSALPKNAAIEMEAVLAL